MKAEQISKVIIEATAKLGIECLTFMHSLLKTGIDLLEVETLMKVLINSKERVDHTKTTLSSTHRQLRKTSKTAQKNFDVIEKTKQYQNDFDFSALSYGSREELFRP
jgi:hypothetical protein